MGELECARTITDLADLWCRMDAHEGQAAWAGAAGSFSAVVVAVGLSLQAYREELDRKRAADRAAAHHALSTARMLYALLKQARDDDKDPTLTSQSAARFLRGGQMREIFSALDELKPKDLHGPYSTQAWVVVRIVARDLESRLGTLIDAPGAAGIVQMGDLQERLEKPIETLRTAELSKRPSRSKFLGIAKRRT